MNIVELNILYDKSKSKKDGVCVAKYQAHKQVKKITKGLNEAKQIHKGQKTAKSFDDFLNEL